MKDVDKTYCMVNNDETGMTQQEVADALGISRGYVSQIEQKALEKIKRRLMNRGIKKEDYFGD